MKKIIIAVAIVCAAVASHAASVRWRASGVMDAANASSYSGSATLHALLTGTDTEVATYNGSMASGAINVVVGDDSLVAGTTYDFYYTMTDNKGNEFTSTKKTSIQAQTTSTPSLLFSAGGSWAAAPEPTSGLLLILGVAGLALRRKRM